MCNAVARKHHIKAIIVRELTSNPHLPDDILRQRIAAEVVPLGEGCATCACFTSQVSALLAKSAGPAHA